LTGCETDRDEAIHQARRCCKRIRSVLRFVRTELPLKLYRVENRSYRDAGRSLGDLREPFAVLQTLDTLTQSQARVRRTAAMVEFRRVLTATHAVRWLNTEHVLGSAITTLRFACDRIADWPFIQTHEASLPGGLALSYQRGRTTQLRSLKNPTMLMLHAWRKDVRYLYEQMKLLRPLAPATLEPFQQELHELENHLSEWHDLAVLRQWVLVTAQELWPLERVEPLLQLIQARQSALLALIKPLGEQVYAEPRKAFVKRINEDWQTWQRDE
jgi:CHAD domain-containing protein